MINNKSTPLVNDIETILNQLSKNTPLQVQSVDDKWCDKTQREVLYFLGSGGSPLKVRVKTIKKVIRIGAYDVPAPLRGAPTEGVYYTIDFTSEDWVLCNKWDNDYMDARASGGSWSDKADAELAAKAIKELLSVENEKDAVEEIIEPGSEETLEGPTHEVCSVDLGPVVNLEDSVPKSDKGIEEFQRYQWLILNASTIDRAGVKKTHLNETGLKYSMTKENRSFYGSTPEAVIDAVMQFDEKNN